MHSLAAATDGDGAERAVTHCHTHCGTVTPAVTLTRLPGHAERIPINFQKASIENVKREVGGLAPSLARREMMEDLRLESPQSKALSVRTLWL